jgi:acetylornithine deacetylase/succinyl-diaminopimelate desuccinylase-like protein
MVAALGLSACAPVQGPAAAQSPNMDQARLRAIYQEMIEIDSSPSTGSCTRVVEAAAARLRSAGFPDADLHIVIPEGEPDDGNLVAVLPAAAPASEKGVLLLAHIDVVDARREDWESDPYTLVEKDGFFIARGAVDDKSMAAAFTDIMIELKQEGYRPRRDIRMALTCGEETSDRVNGVDYLLTNRRPLIDAALALNEGAGGVLAADGETRIALNIQAGEKIHQVYELEVENPGGHSSRPRPDNAINQLAAALQAVAGHRFPIQVTPVTRSYFEQMAPLVGGDEGRAMAALAANPGDVALAETVAANPSYNAILRTTCVATQLDAGHAANALPQRARATLSCRVMQGTTPDQVKEALDAAIADPGVKVSIVRRRDGSSPPELTAEIMGATQRTVERLWPGTPIIPTMSAGATDGRFLMNAGIPTYGLSGLFAIPGETNAHGLNEKLRVRSFYESREFLELVTRDLTKPS